MNIIKYLIVGALLVLLSISVYLLNAEQYQVRMHATFVDRSTAIQLLRHCMQEKGVLTESMQDRQGRLVRVQCRAYIYYSDFDEHTEVTK